MRAARYNLGATLINLGRHAEALPHLERTIDMEPDHAMAHAARATALAALGRHAEAARSHDRAVRLNPGYALGPWTGGGDEPPGGKLGRAAGLPGRGG